jgi:UDP-galactopyranose mutase
LVHRYGPHLFHTDSDEAFDYLSKFTKWQSYTHKVLARVEDKKVPIPFNFNSIVELFDEKTAENYITKLIDKFGKDKRIPILKLLKESDEDINQLGVYIYENVYAQYTAKQWGRKLEEIDPLVSARVPVVTSDDNRYFTDKYQFVPQDGYTKIFEKMLDHKNITLLLNTDAMNYIRLNHKKIYFKNEEFEGKIIFTGMIDELFNFCYGELPYRSIDLKFEVIDRPYFQRNSVINYPNDYAFTRITEFKHIHPVKSDKTVILREHPEPYKKGKNLPYYPIFTEDNHINYEVYASLAKKYENLILIGRLAEHKYYNMDDIVLRALKVFEEQISNES